ncbi:Uveal autoantigen with coiled-coil domains and ankyrin repeats isoform 1 [Senna tora]|uniref:Uveal autoantigen with coiled-coil domains and ankyrin repeats isoform 1 n=1 Tax=Senna tora TaxID=362788 RepID=A0A834W249_9FABA|nr:Uveal autoantigen with coiled-coil domains and ankyrin repeats isoform 1 [Senna tora]
MGYSYTPTYYSSLHDSITSLCKTLLPFGFKRRWRLPGSDHRLLKLQSENLKWQQDSFHQMLNLMGLHREGILAQNEVSLFSAHLLETLIASPPHQEHPLILRDKLLFLQELLYAKCISEEEYHASKRPLIQRLAVQGAEIEARDVIIAGKKDPKDNSSEEEWSVIDLKDENCLLNKENSNSKNKSKQGSAMKKQIKGAASVFGFVSSSSHKPSKNRTEKSIFDSPSSSHLNSTPSKFSSSASKENPFWNSQSKNQKSEEKLKRKPFRTLFQREQREAHGGGAESEEREGKSEKKQWGFDGSKKWKNTDSDDETAPLPLNERSDNETYLAASEIDTTKFMTSDYFIDKVCVPSQFHSIFNLVSGQKIKKEVSTIQTEQRTTNPNHTYSYVVFSIICHLFYSLTISFSLMSIPFCDRYRDAVLDVKKESTDNGGEKDNMWNNKNAREEHSYSMMQWTTFEDDENLHPNLFTHQDSSFRSSNINPFSQ